MQPNALKKLASKRDINVLPLLSAVNLAWSSTRCELEGRPIEYGIILGSVDSIFSAVSQSYFRRRALNNISKMTCTELLQNFGGLYEWNKSALIIDSHTTKVKGLLDLSALKVEDPYEYISRITDSICVVTKKAFSVRVYYDGELKIQYIFNRKRAVIEERILEEFVPTLTNRQVRSEVAKKILDACLRISEIRKGTLIVLGSLPYHDVLSETALNAVHAYMPEKVTTLSQSALMHYAMKDGAIWIDGNGMVRGHGLTFIGPGGRHAIAKYLTSKIKSIVVMAVSQDGEINAFCRNKVKRFASQIISDRLFVEEVQ